MQPNNDMEIWMKLNKSELNCDVNWLGDCDFLMTLHFNVAVTSQCTITSNIQGGELAQW